MRKADEPIFRDSTAERSGVLRNMVFSHDNGSTDLDLLQINTTGGLIADSYIKNGGTSSHFLKADGSVDNNTYLTSASANATFAPADRVQFDYFY